MNSTIHGVEQTKRCILETGIVMCCCKLHVSQVTAYYLNLRLQYCLQYLPNATADVNIRARIRLTACDGTTLDTSSHMLLSLVV